MNPAHTEYIYPWHTMQIQNTVGFKSLFICLPRSWFFISDGSLEHVAHVGYYCSNSGFSFRLHLQVCNIDLCPYVIHFDPCL